MTKIDMKKARREGREYTTHALRYLTRPISKLLIKYTRVTPNQVTFFSFLMGIIAGIFLLQGGYNNQVIAAIFAMLYILFDLMDGEIARVRNMTSNLGKWLDGIIGIIMVPYLIYCLTFGLKNYLAFVIGGIAIVCYPIQYALIYYYKFDIVKSDQKISLPSKFSSVSSLRRLYGSVTFYPLLFVSLIFNKGFYLLFFYAIFGNLFWLLVLATQYINLKKRQKK